VKYALLVYSDQSTWDSYTEEEAARLREESLPKWYACFEELGKADPDMSGYELEAASDAKVVRVRDGERIVTDGPFAETKEALAGFYLVEARDLNEAIQIASRIPPAQVGSIEVRPIRPIREFPRTPAERK
jgi:hypothetical protein